MSDNVTPMPGVSLPVQATGEPDENTANLLKMVDELRGLVASGQVRWLAMTGQFENAQRLSAFGNVHRADAIVVVGSLEWLKAEYQAMFAASRPVHPG